MAQEAVGVVVSFSETSTPDLPVIELTLPGLDGGDKIDATLLANGEYMTYIGRQLKEIPDMGFTAEYDPINYTEFEAIINVNQEITFTFPGTPSIAITIWGFLQSYNPDTATYGDRMKVTGNFVASNLNGSGDETAPTLVST